MSLGAAVLWQFVQSSGRLDRGQWLFFRVVGQRLVGLVLGRRLGVNRQVESAFSAFNATADR